jgi:elongation factor G
MTSQTAHPRTILITGPYQSGKTALLESILHMTGALHRKPEPGKRAFGDQSAEAKSLEMGTEMNIASCSFMGETYHFLD